MRCRTALLALLAAILLGMGAPGLRALHLVTDPARHGGPDCVHHACTDSHDAEHHGHAAGHDGADAHGGERVPSHHPGEDCATCELLLALVAGSEAPLAVPTFHARVLAEPRPATAPARSLAVPLVTAARPPPSALT